MGPYVYNTIHPSVPSVSPDVMTEKKNRIPVLGDHVHVVGTIRYGTKKTFRIMDHLYKPSEMSLNEATGMVVRCDSTELVLTIDQHPSDDHNKQYVTVMLPCSKMEFVETSSEKTDANTCSDYVTVFEYYMARLESAVFPRPAPTKNNNNSSAYQMFMFH